MSRRTRVIFNHFPRLARELEPAGDAASSKAAEALATDIRASVRIETGELRDSVFASKGRDGYVVGAGADQALSEEFGTSRQEAHPTFGPAAERARGPFTEAVATEINRRLR